MEKERGQDKDLFRLSVRHGGNPRSGFKQGTGWYRACAGPDSGSKIGDYRV